MQNYSARVNFDGDDEKEILVVSNNCRYFVWLNGGCSIQGPGVDESVEDFVSPSFLSVEDKAIYAVLLFESGLFNESEEGD